MKLRTIRRMLDKRKAELTCYVIDSDPNTQELEVWNAKQSKWERLPNYCFPPSDVRNGSDRVMMSYCSRELDKLISIHGPDYRPDSNRKEGDDDSDGLEKGGREGSSSETANHPADSTAELSKPADHGACGDQQGDGGRGAVSGSNAGTSQSGGEDYAAADKPMDGKQLSQMAPGKTTSSDSNGDKSGVGSQTDTHSGDAHRPSLSQLEGLKNNLQGVVRGDASNLEGGMYPHPLSIPDGFKETVNSHEMRDTERTETCLGNISRQCRWRNSDPGGYVDMALAKLNSKHERKQAQSIARAVDRYFDAVEVGTGFEATPRIDAKRLIKEITGKSYRMSRTGKEEKGTGLKLVMVDISPSCSSVRDKAMAAAVALAANDPDIVVMGHYNGWVGRGDTYVIGTRQSELPFPTRGSDREKTAAAFIEKMDGISGVIAFGDSDAQGLYERISAVTNFVWLSCMDKRSTELCASNCKGVAVPDVTDARSAVHGLRLAVKELNGVLR